MQKSLLILFALSFLASAVSGQSCGIVGTNETTVLLETLTESTIGETLIARLELFNVVSTSAISSPHYKYVKALRYANGVYELWTEEIFPTFVSVERAQFIERIVNFKCADDSTRRITFIIPVTDENDNAPKFNQNAYNLTVELPLIPSGNTTTVRTGILVTDADLEFENANVHITSSNRGFSPIVTKQWTGTYPEVYGYQVDFLVDTSLEAGLYTTIVTADDGKHPTIVVVNIQVLPAGPPATEQTLAPTTTLATTTSTTTTTTTTTSRPSPEPTLPAANGTAY